MPKLTYIIPCYFNEQNIPLTKKELIENEKRFPSDVSFEYVMIDDGSGDNTLAELIKFKEENPEKVKIIKLSGNFGSYNAILAGMNYSTGDCNVILAADLQDPPDLIPKMYEYWLKGLKLVIANRQEREESFFQRVFSNTFHFLIKKLALKNVPKGGFDLVLFDRQLKDEVVKINEKNTNQIYLLAWLKYDYVNIPYTRKRREVGKSRWTVSKKIKLFVDSFVSFSFFPIRLISVVGLVLGFLSFLYGLFVIYAKVTGLVPVQGWTAIMVVLLLVSSFQMIALGIIGEYVWRAMDAARNRPNFIIEKVY
ncbi:MAG: glycosyltransferase family 2 protein [Bacteroidetes bacterium]|nr:glycosyltransferase family 2 protein [Bacteroidota bacterium]